MAARRLTVTEPAPLSDLVERVEPKPLSIVRENLLTRKGYAPYCMQCPSFARMRFMGEQFRCASCGGQTAFEAEFIEQYRQAQAALTTQEP